MPTDSLYGTIEANRAKWAAAKERNRLAAMTFHERKAERVAKRRKEANDA